MRIQTGLCSMGCGEPGGASGLLFESQEYGPPTKEQNVSPLPGPAQNLQQALALFALALAE